MECCRRVHPDLYWELKKASILPDRLGLYELTEYFCENYQSPLHQDVDGTKSLCCQYHLNADQDLDEFAFIYAEYGYYMQSRENSFWYDFNLHFQEVQFDKESRSFDGNETHGTMLPSTAPFGSPNGGNEPRRSSSGTHSNKNKKDMAAASRIQKSRACREKTHRWWEEFYS